MNKVREIVLEGMNPYLDFAEHKDLIAITVGPEYFTYDCETDADLDADFCEVIAVVEKDWLFSIMLQEGIEDPLDYLQNEYTYDDSWPWFENAKENGKVAVIEFN